MRIRKKTKVVGGVVGGVVIVGLMVGLAIAYFSYQAQSQPLSLTTGQFSLVVNQQPDAIQPAWLPGESRQLSWSVANTGTAPVFLKGQLNGSWQDSQLSSSKVTLAQLQMKRASDAVMTTVPLVDTNLPVSFLFSPTTNESELWEIQPGETIDLQADLFLSNSAGNEYQGAELASVLTVTARQTTAGASWEE